MNAQFITALSNGDRAAMVNIPKADRHCHSLLGGKRETASRLLGRELVPPPSGMNSIEVMNSYLDDVFSFGIDRKVIEKLFEAALLTALDDGVVLLEASIDCSNTKYYPGGADEMTAAFRDIHRNTAPQIELIPQLGMIRERDITELETMAKSCIDTGYFCSLDLYSVETARAPGEFTPIYSYARDHGMKLKAHTGEFGDAEQVRRTVETLDLDEVMHGITAAGSPSVMEFLARRGTVLHVCPTSNLMLGRVKSIADHPIRALVDGGINVTINSDDIFVFGNTVSDEFLALYRHGVLDAGDLDTIRERGLKVI
ncbi:MAG: hypothetical protein A2Y33_08810 [Spirochaetes bacterium GWF1_51_8]|nr:MAG: hypothetical protein A2Y33_08810 [Spirochaetes bacterium GWF1_51_8]